MQVHYLIKNLKNHQLPISMIFLVLIVLNNQIHHLDIRIHRIINQNKKIKNYWYFKITI